MRVLISLCALVVAASLPTQANAQSCSGAAPPTRPVNSEDFNPGLGGELGLNDDFHDDIAEPFDEPGRVISTLTRELARDDERGGINLLRPIVGLDCSAPGSGE